MKKDELNNLNINNSDGHYNAKENPLNDIKEVEKVPEIEKSEKEVFQASEENKIEEDSGNPSLENSNQSNSDTSSSSSTAGATSSSAAIGAVGGVVGVVAISTVLVLGVIKLPVIPAVDVSLISASATSLAFELSTNIENHSNLIISLKGEDYIVSTPFQEYVKFSDLRQNDVYTLSVYENETSRYSSIFYTNEKEDINNVTITVTSYIDDKLLFYFEDSFPGEKVYTVNVKDKSGKAIFTDETQTPRDYEIDNFKDDVAIFISVNGTITAGVQVFKPLYDYENINWVWGDYGETVTAIIPSTNGTNDYYVRDIRNFEIDRKEATCTEDGYSIRQAAFIGPDKNRYEDQREFTLPAKGHIFGDLIYEWSEDYKTCHAYGTCLDCQLSISEDVTCEVENIVTETGLSYTKYTAPFQNENFSTRYHFEDLTYGSYPQSKVTDTTLIQSLNSQYGDPMTQSGNWLAYDYYASSTSNQYMFYVDVDSDNDNHFDYRGVYFTSYRPINAEDALGNSSYQYDNGYQTNTTYWFEYEPIKWNVLDHDDGSLFITSEVILDSQSHYHQNKDTEFIHNGGTGYANNYELSDIRTWLNSEFYNSALPSSKNDVVKLTTVDNSIDSTLDNTNEYTCNDTEDRVFLLSRSEIKEYLSTSQSTVSGSDYAKCQGLYVALQNDKAFWSLRTPYPNAAYEIRYITNNGSISYDSISKTSLGVRPACWINID